nr:site-specific DNA-methyltransferase [uncultured Acetatifactor sp.]
MANFYETVLTVLKSDERFVAEDGTFLRNAVYEAAMKMDGGLICLLLTNDETRNRFFAEVDGIKVFDKVGFAWVINNRQFLPDSYTRFKNKIGLVDGSGQMLATSGEVELVFPYKDCVLEGGQTKEDQKRSEIFYNEMLAPDAVDRLLYPKVFCKARRYTASGIEGNITFTDEDNLIIKGNNLLAISSLLKRFEGRIKCIYIDPPYFFNEAKEADSFKYNSNFHLSSWLVFMKNRLEIAQKLLATGGTIWISIGEDGMHYLKVMADGIFGRDHFVGTIPRRTRNGKSDVPFNLSQDFDWLLCYTNVDSRNNVIGRSVTRKYYETDDFPGEPWRLADLTKQTTAGERANSFFTIVNPKNGEEYPASPKRTWCITEDTFDYYYQKGAIVFPGDYNFLNIGKPYMRKFKSEDDCSGKLSAVISDFQIQGFLQTLFGNAKNKDGNSEIDAMFGREEFDYAKPENLIKAILEVATSEGDIVLDFHLGSGTTCAVAHKLGRQYIGVEQMDYIENVSVERLKKVIEGEQGGISKEVNWQGGGSFVYCELAKLNQTIMEEIEAATDDVALSDIYGRMVKSGFINYKVNPADIDAAADDYAALSLDDKKRFLMEILDKNLLYVNYCDIDDEEFGISDEDKAFTRSFYREV